MRTAPGQGPLPYATAAAALAATVAALLTLAHPGPWWAVAAAALSLGAFARSAAMVVRAVRAQRRLNQQYLEQFAEARVLSHEIRTPLAIIQGAAELLAPAGEGLDDQQRSFLRAIVTNTDSLRRLVDDLLTQARIDANVFTIRRETTDYRELIRVIVDELRAIYPSKILLSNLRAPLLVDVDPTLLRQVLINLISNCLR